MELVRDILSFPALRSSTIVLYDIDVLSAERTAASARELIELGALPTRIEVPTTLREALRGADVAITVFQVGGVDAFALDIEIPHEYGIDQTVGDTLGPGGIFRGLRTVPALREVAEAMAEICPDALLLNYANPMSINCWATDLLDARIVGLCHSVQGTSEHHASEYWAWFRRTPELIEAYLDRRWNYLEVSRSSDASESNAEIVADARANGIRHGGEFAAPIIDSIVTGTERIVYGNVRNGGLIGNLPADACVEVACRVDATGVHPVPYGTLPPACAALNEIQITVQRLAVQAAMTGHAHLVHAAIALDPLTGAVQTLPKIHEMVDRMLEAEARWLPQFTAPVDVG